MGALGLLRVPERSDPNRMSLPSPCVLIANPAAGHGHGEEALDVVDRTLRAGGIEVRIHRTTAAGDAVTIAQEAATQGVGAVVAIGGDGTVHEVVNGLLNADVNERPALGLVPVGTGNDYAKMVTLPKGDPEGAAQVLLRGNLLNVDLPVDFDDSLKCTQAFEGKPYPFDGPTACP